MIKKGANFICGTAAPCLLYYFLYVYIRQKRIAPVFPALAGVCLLIFLLTGADRKYRFLPLWKRVLRFLIFPVFLFFIAASVLGFAENDLRTGFTLFAVALVVLLVYHVLFGLTANITDSAIEAMSGAEFEEFCADVLAKNGYHDVKVTHASNDYGADITAARNGEIWVVQCKRYSTKLGNTPVQEVVASMSYYGAQRAAVMTNAEFTPNAVRLAEKNGVLLIDREMLRNMRK